MFQSRAPSTRKLYALKWKLFTSWCGDHQLDPVNCTVGTVLEFLQARLSAGLTHSTLKVYVVTITVHHASLDGQSVGRNPLITHFLCGALRLRPPVQSSILPRFLLLREFGDLQALSVASTHLDFAPGMAKALLYPRVEHVPKVPHVTPQTVVLQAFSPSPFGEPDQQKLNCMRALDAYVHRTALWRVDQLLVCCGLSKRGLVSQSVIFIYKARLKTTAVGQSAVQK